MLVAVSKSRLWETLKFFDAVSSSFGSKYLRNIVKLQLSADGFLEITASDGECYAFDRMEVEQIVDAGDGSPIWTTTKLFGLMEKKSTGNLWIESKSTSIVLRGEDFEWVIPKTQLVEDWNIPSLLEKSTCTFRIEEPQRFADFLSSSQPFASENPKIHIPTLCMDLKETEVVCVSTTERHMIVETFPVTYLEGDFRGKILVPHTYITSVYKARLPDTLKVMEEGRGLWLEGNGWFVVFPLLNPPHYAEQYEAVLANRNKYPERVSFEASKQHLADMLRRFDNVVRVGSVVRLSGQGYTIQMELESDDICTARVFSLEGSVAGTIKYPVKIVQQEGKATFNLYVNSKLLSNALSAFSGVQRLKVTVYSDTANKRGGMVSLEGKNTRIVLIATTIGPSGVIQND